MGIQRTDAGRAGACPTLGTDQRNGSCSCHVAHRGRSCGRFRAHLCADADAARVLVATIHRHLRSLIVMPPGVNGESICDAIRLMGDDHLPVVVVADEQDRRRRNQRLADYALHRQLRSGEDACVGVATGMPLGARTLAEVTK